MPGIFACSAIRKVFRLFYWNKNDIKSFRWTVSLSSSNLFLFSGSWDHVGKGAEHALAVLLHVHPALRAVQHEQAGRTPTGEVIEYKQKFCRSYAEYTRGYIVQKDKQKCWIKIFFFHEYVKKIFGIWNITSRLWLVLTYRLNCYWMEGSG